MDKKPPLPIYFRGLVPAETSPWFNTNPYEKTTPPRPSRISGFVEKRQPENRLKDSRSALLRVFGHCRKLPKNAGLVAVHCRLENGNGSTRGIPQWPTKELLRNQETRVHTETKSYDINFEILPGVSLPLGAGAWSRSRGATGFSRCKSADEVKDSVNIGELPAAVVGRCWRG